MAPAIEGRRVVVKPCSENTRRVLKLTLSGKVWVIFDLPSKSATILPLSPQASSLSGFNVDLPSVYGLEDPISCANYL